MNLFGLTANLNLLSGRRCNLAELKTTAEQRSILRTHKFTHELIDDIETLLAENQRLAAEVERLKEYEWRYKDLCE